MHVDEVLRGMRSGTPQPDEAIEAFVDGVVNGAVSRPQVAAWLAWAFARTLEPSETVTLTRAMTRSGRVLTWPDGPELVDKHSTGGVGDKVSLVLAPLWAELGFRVPMLSGRGLGHTGGTLDKLESIPGYRTDLTVDDLRYVLRTSGCFISGQTEELAPADRVMYAVRNEVQCVESVPLIVASILSKKLASGVRRLVLDVKAGSGAFMEDLDTARALARALVDVGARSGLACRAYLTEMSRPLGATVGNALEVSEAIACLKGESTDDLRDLTLALADHPDAAEVLASGRAAERFARMIEAQGGDAGVVDDPSRLLGGGAETWVLAAASRGVVREVDARAVGLAAFRLGAGRAREGDAVDPGVGIELLVTVGDQVNQDQPVAVVHHRDGRGLDEAIALLNHGIDVGEGPVRPAPLVHEVIGG